MSVINSRVQQYSNNVLSKAQYIDEMANIHQILIDYSKHLPKTSIEKIEIIDNNVLMTFRHSNIVMKFIEGDKRIACIDALNFNTYEEEELAMQYKLIKDGDVVFDIGANYGWYSMHIAKSNPRSKVYSFEPLPKTFSIFSENLLTNKIENIIPFNIGLSDSIGEMTFYVDPKLTVNASLNNVSESSNALEIKCLVDVVDSFVHQHKIENLDFIKCDIEGAELFALKGAKNTLQNFQPKLFVEMLRKWSKQFGYHPNDIILYLKDLGYRCFVIKSELLAEVFEVDENTVETNFVFLHNEKHFEEISNLTNMV